MRYLIEILYLKSRTFQHLLLHLVDAGANYMENNTAICSMQVSENIRATLIILKGY